MKRVLLIYLYVCYETASWIDFQAAMNRIKEVHTTNQSDAIAQLMTKLQNPAKLLISDSDMGTIVKSIFDNLRKAYGTPQKVLSQIIREHNKVGGIPASGTDRKHITYSTFYQQTSLTKETVSLLEKDKQSYTSQKI